MQKSVSLKPRFEIDAELDRGIATILRKPMVLRVVSAPLESQFVQIKHFVDFVEPSRGDMQVQPIILTRNRGRSN